MTRRVMTVIGAGILVVFAFPLAAWAEPLEPFLERSAAAEFTGQQLVSCDTPDGNRTVAIELTQSDGVTVAHDAVGGEGQVRVAGGSFSVSTSDGIVGTSAALAEAVPPGAYSVARVEMTRALGRDAQRVTIVDESGVGRATMTFDSATGAMLSARIRNADQSVYCVMRMVEFDDFVAPETAAAIAPEDTRRLESIEAPADIRLPDDVAGFSRLDTYDWDRGGVVAYYSDGLFSFALLATDRPVVLDDSTARPVQIGGGDYVRWFGAGQMIYVWETADGGLAMYGDLPLDLQEDVLDGLPEPQRLGVLTRWWRNLFG